MKKNIKELINQQIVNELAYAKNNATPLVRKLMAPVREDIHKAANDLIVQLKNTPEEMYWYANKEGELVEWHGLREIHQYILNQVGLEGVIELFYRAYSVVMPAGNNYPTLQNVVGALLGSFKGIDQVYRQLQAVEIVLSKTPFLVLHAPKGALNAFISCKCKFNEDELKQLNQQATALPSIVKPKKVRNNYDIGYRTFKKSLIMGGKSHDKPCNLAHINRRNAIAFRIDTRITEMYTPVFKEELKIKKSTGLYETPAEMEKRKKNWGDMMREMPQKIAVVANKDVYFAHRYDNRYRTYAEQHHINYQGNDYQKAMVELAHKEAIDGDW